jgi:hypothetical protein
MNLPKKLKSTRLIAIISCLLAVGAYSAFLPPPASADDEEFGLVCLYAGLAYDIGACRGGQRCKNDNGTPVWEDDSTCPHLAD